MSGRQPVDTDSAPSPIGPYSQAIEGGGFVFASGQVGIDPASGEITGSDAAAQAEQALRNVSAVLDAAGTGWGRVVKTTILLISMDDFVAVNAVYARYATPPYPARSTVAVAQLPKGALVEIECLALAGDG